MKSYYKIAAILLFSMFITVFVSPIIASIASFHLYKVMSRTILITAFLLFYYYKNRLGFNSIRELGFEFNKRWWILLAIGLGAGLISMAIISATMLHTSIRFIVPDILSINWLGHLTSYLFIGFIVAFIEECFFRGFILQILLKDSRVFISLFLTNIFYSIVHFLRPEIIGNVEVFNIFSSLNAVPLFFAPLFTEIPKIWPSMIGLFLVGVVLSLAYIRVRTLALSIGLHAGWVIGIKSISLGTDTTTFGSIWINGNVVANPFTWYVLLIFIFLLSWPRHGIKKLDK